MFSEAQFQYIEDVLGVSPNHFSFTPSADAEELDVLVLTAKLNDDERALLAKILGAIALKDHHHLELDFHLDWRAGLPASRHMLIFNSTPAIDRAEEGDGVTWSFPALNEMTGSSADVAASKKSTWALLQRFAKERA